MFIMQYNVGRNRNAFVAILKPPITFFVEESNFLFRNKSRCWLSFDVVRLLKEKNISD